MSTHQFNDKMLSDGFFVPGELKFLVVGNECRLLDKRRTPGFIRSFDRESGFFRWEITDFEDKGKFWDVDFERITTYQFGRNSKSLEPEEVEIFFKNIAPLIKPIEITASDSEKSLTNKYLGVCLDEANQWLLRHSKFFEAYQKIDFQCLIGPQLLRDDFNHFMSENGLSEIETRTSESQVLNPHSGDWIRAMQIVMAEMGLKNYVGRDIRLREEFQGLGSRENRREYISYRTGFLRSMFGLLGFKEIELYRGMSTEWNWQPNIHKQYRFWSSWTFNFKVAQDFSDLNPGSKQKNSYLIKRAIPVDQLFMTFLETDAMNRQYYEAEALVLHSENDNLLW